MKFFRIQISVNFLGYFWIFFIMRIMNYENITVEEIMNINQPCQWDQIMFNGYENHALLWCPKISTLTFSPFRFQNTGGVSHIITFIF